MSDVYLFMEEPIIPYDLNVVKYALSFRYKSNRGSANGRQNDSGSLNRGSNPCPLANMSTILQQLNKEELEFIFKNSGSGVRRATVISAYIEWQIFYLASKFLENCKVVYDPEPMQEYRQSLNILKTNNMLNDGEIKGLEEFRRQRNKSIHGIFKGMTRDEWNLQSKLVIDLGRPIIKELNKKINALHTEL